jgi:hypothetical protein
MSGRRSGTRSAFSLAALFLLTAAAPHYPRYRLTSIREVTIPITRTGPYVWRSEPLGALGHPALAMDWSIEGLPDPRDQEGEAEVRTLAMGIRTTPQGSVFEVRFRVTSFRNGAQFLVHSVQREPDTGGC